MEYSKLQTSLSIAIANYDGNVIQEAKQLKRKYESIMVSYDILKRDILAVKAEVRDMQRQKKNLKAQKGRLDTTIKNLEKQVLNKMEKTVEKLEETAREMGTIESLDL